MTKAELEKALDCLSLENEDSTIEESLKDMDKLIYEPVYTKIKTNDCDSGRFPEL